MLRRKMIRRLGILFGLSCVLAIAIPSFADIHLVRSMHWEYGGYPQGEEMLLDVWLSGTAERRMYKNNIIIHQFEKDIRWTIDAIATTFKESPIEAEAEEEVSEEKLHNEGFVYEPVFDWTLQEMDQDTILCGIPCKKYILDGDADYAEKIVEIWAADNIGSYVNVHEKSLHYLQGRETAEVIDQFPELKERIVLYEKTTSEAAISPTKVIIVEIILLENTTPPHGMYELPQGLKRID